MPMLQNHKIHTASLQVDFEGLEEGLGLQDSLGLFFYEKIKPALEKVFDRHGNPNETIVLDKLELDCGNLSYSNWEEEFLQKILVQLEENLKLPQIGKKEIVPVEKKAEEVFIHFLEKGYFPWNSSFSSPRELEDSVVLEMSFLENLKKILIKSPAFFQRLFGSFSEDFISRIIIAWSQKLNSHESDLVKYLNRSRNTALNKILIRTLGLTFSDPDPASSGQFLKIMINQCSQENLSALAEYFGQELVRDRKLLGAFTALFTEVSNPGFQKKKMILWKKILRIDPEIILKLKNSLPELDFQILTKATHNGINLAEEGAEMDFSESLSGLEKITNKEEMGQEIENESEFSGEIFVENAGLVLLHPFLTGLFSNLQLTENGKFVAEYDQCLAARVLQFLVYGENNLSENFYPLNKILCGMGVSQILGEEVEISEQFKIESEELLQAVIGHWSVLKNTSIGGLRETFLQRNGKISRVEKGWKLQVERKTVDVLLAKLPWGMGIVKLPWMEDMMFVEWE
jgi:hypothetical protein